MTRRQALMLAPLGVAVAAGGGFYAMLRGMERGSFNPRATGDPLLNHPVPDFALPAQPPGAGFGSADLRAANGPVLVNFFASWCVPCLVEHPQLMTLGKELPIWGIAYKDTADRVDTLLGRDGNPYARVGRDAPGRVAIDFGITGVPETFLVSAGLIRWHFPGPLTPEAVEDQLRPALRAFL